MRLLAAAHVRLRFQSLIWKSPRGQQRRRSAALGAVSPEALKRILDAFRAGETPAPGSAIGRHASEPTGGPHILTDPSLYDGSCAKPITRLPNAPEPA